MAFEGLTEKISATFKKLRGKGRLKEADVKEAMREIRMALLEADVSYKVVKDFTKSVTERCIGADVLESLTPAQMIVKIVNEELCKLMGSDTKHININPNGPTVVMLVGLQGAGKTTNGSKLAGLMKRQGHKEEPGRAKITKAYNLPCRYVLHTIGPVIGDAVAVSDRRLLADCYRSCLDLAAKHGLHSVAFCCISTGEFRFPNELAAQVAIQTVIQWQRENPNQIEVIFNVFKERDYDIYEKLLRADRKTQI